MSAPVVLDIRTSAPAIVAVTQNGAREVATFPAGVELHRYAAPGRALIEIYSPHDGALSGTLTIATTPVIPVKDGVNDLVALGPAGGALFSFEVTKAGEIGLGLRAEPDRAALRLFDAAGKTLGDGAAQILRLEPGRYFVEARAPADAPATIVRLALRGLAPPPSGPPPDVVAEFLEEGRTKERPMTTLGSLRSAHSTNALRPIRGSAMKRILCLFSDLSATVVSVATRSRGAVAARRATMWRLAVLLVACLGVSAPLRAEPAPFDRLHRADGARIVPDKFLRSYDPITVFFDRDVGPKAGGPEDAHREIRAAHAASPPANGAGSARAPCNFVPLSHGSRCSASRSMPAPPRRGWSRCCRRPPRQIPPESADPIADLEQITLTFPEPVDIAALARLLTIELRPAPGIAPLGGQLLTAKDYDIRPLERADRNAAQSVAIRLRETIRDGRVAILRLKLADEPGLDDEIFELRARSAAPFSVTEASCGRGWSDDKQDGVLRCAFGYAVAPSTAASEGEEESAPVSNYQPANRRRLTLTFTEQPDEIDILRAREALRVSPPVDDLAVEIDRKRLNVYGAVPLRSRL